MSPIRREADALVGYVRSEPARAPQCASLPRFEMPFLRLSIVALMIGLAANSSLASWLPLFPRLWVAFAAFLNPTIVRFNPPFRSAAWDDRRPSNPPDPGSLVLVVRRPSVRCQKM